MPRHVASTLECDTTCVQQQAAAAVEICKYPNRRIKCSCNLCLWGSESDIEIVRLQSLTSAVMFSSLRASLSRLSLTTSSALPKATTGTKLPDIARWPEMTTALPALSSVMPIREYRSRPPSSTHVNGYYMAPPSKHDVWYEVFLILCLYMGYTLHFACLSGRRNTRCTITAGSLTR